MVDSVLNMRERAAYFSELHGERYQAQYYNDKTFGEYVSDIQQSLTKKSMLQTSLRNAMIEKILAG